MSERRFLKLSKPDFSRGHQFKATPSSSSQPLDQPLVPTADLTGESLAETHKKSIYG
jgi:hypothetical protein